MSLLRWVFQKPALLFGIAIACWTVLAGAQAAPSASMNGSYRIAGVVVNAVSGEPVRRAIVQTLKVDDGRAVASGVTDNDGRFALEGLEAAKYQLTASKRGFRTGYYDEHEEFSSAIVTGPDQDTGHLEFRLMPHAVLHGLVTDDGGEPVANARVMLFNRPKHSEAGERITQADAATTDDTGAYELGDLAAGEYLLAVVAEPWYAVHTPTVGKPGANRELDVAYPVTYFDSTTEEQSATPIVLSGGSHEEANISLHAVPALHLFVPAPKNPEGVSVFPQVQRMVFGTPVSNDASANFGGLETGLIEVAGIAPGHYQVTQGDPPRVADLALSSNQQLDTNAGVVANTIEGRVRTLSGELPPEPMTLSLERMDGGVGQNQYAAEVRQGRFRLEGVPPGEWRVWATNGDKALTVTSVGTGDRRVTGNVVTLADRTGPLTVTIAEAGTRVEGFAKRAGKGVAGVMTVLLPKNPTAWRAMTRRDESDSDGSFSFRDVVPGEYTAIAIEDGWPLDWTSPAQMARFLPGGTNVTVTDKPGAAIHLSSSVAVQQR